MQNNTLYYFINISLIDLVNLIWNKDDRVFSNEFGFCEDISIYF